MNTEECILCGLKEWGSILIVKEPEHVFQCLDCACKYKDDNKYNVKEGNGRCIYIIGKGYVDNQGNQI